MPKSSHKSFFAKSRTIFKKNGTPRGRIVELHTLNMSEQTMFLISKSRCQSVLKVSSLSPISFNCRNGLVKGRLPTACHNSQTQNTFSRFFAWILKVLDGNHQIYKSILFGKYTLSKHPYVFSGRNSNHRKLHYFEHLVRGPKIARDSACQSLCLSMSVNQH